MSRDAPTVPIRLVVLDVDGVLTDGSIHMDDAGREGKSFYARDGLGIYLLHRAGIRLALVSGRTAEVIEHRARQLRIEEVHQGVEDKLAVYREILARHGLRDEEVCYMGDDLIDLPPMRRAGLAAAPADAHPIVLQVADLVTRAPGGRGAVRELAERLLQAAGLWDEIAGPYLR